MVQTPESVRLNAKGQPYNFQTIGQSSAHWSYQADNLRKVAEKTFQLAKEDLENNLTAWHRVDLIYKFLAGAALENLLKGIMIIDDPSLVRRRSMSREISRHHNIWTTHACGRLKTVKQRLAPKQQKFLEQVEPYVWIGRYGIGTNETAYINGIRAVNDPKALTSLDEFHRTFEEVFFKLLGILSEKSVADVIAEEEKAQADLVAKL